MERQFYLGGHDIACILGHGFNSAWHVFMMKTNEGYRKEQELSGKDNKQFKIGNALESVALDFAMSVYPEGTKRVKAEFVSNGKYFGGTPDEVIIAPNGKKFLTEAKTSSQPDLWGDEGTDQVPLKYKMQALWYMGLIPDVEGVYFSVIFFGMTHKMYYVKRDNEEIAKMQEAAKNFWENHVAVNVPPEIDHSDACKWYHLDFPREEKKEIEADDEMNTMAVSMINDRKAKTIAEENYKMACNRLLNNMFDASKIKGDGWSFSVSKNGRITFKVKGE